MPQAVKGGRALRLGWASWEVAAWEIAQLGSYYFGNCTVGKLLFEKLFSWEVTAWEIPQLGIYCLGNRTVGKLLLGKLYSWEVTAWEIVQLGSCRFWKKSLG